MNTRIGRSFPDYILACVGGGSNAAGGFYAFLENPAVHLVGAEAAGKGVETSETAATLALGKTGILHGSKSKLIQDEYGQVTEPYSISAGLDYPGVGPLHSYLQSTGRCTYLPVTDEEALAAAIELTRLEGIIPALESAHALALLGKLPWDPHGHTVIILSGRGDKDMDTYSKYFGHESH
jgi:tryptophan synthase beta chain